MALHEKLSSGIQQKEEDEMNQERGCRARQLAILHAGFSGEKLVHMAPKRATQRPS